MTLQEYIDQDLPFYHITPSSNLGKILREGLIAKRCNAICVVRSDNPDIWKEIIKQYRPSFVGECDNVVKMSHELVKGWLQDCMFKDSESKEQKAQVVMGELASHDASKVHDRHYDFVKCKELGLNVTALEENQDLQEVVLSLYHCYLLSIYRLPSAVKFIESQHGESFIINGIR